MKIYKKILISYLLFSVSTAVFFCFSMGTMSEFSMPTNMGEMKNDMAKSADAVANHLIQAQKLASANLGLEFTTIAFLALLFISFALPLFKLSNIFFQSNLLYKLKWRRRSFLSKIEENIQTFLSRFIRSPQYI